MQNAVYQKILDFNDIVDVGKVINVGIQREKFHLKEIVEKVAVEVGRIQYKIDFRRLWY